MKKTNRILSLVLVVLIFLCLFTSCGKDKADEPPIQETVSYYESYEDGVEYNYDEKTHTLTISGKGEIQPPLYWNDTSNIKHIVITNGITNINDYAFSWSDTETFENSNFGTFETVKMSNSVINIGSNAFLDCYKLNTVKLSNKLKSIGENAFAGCEKLTDIRIPNSVNLIGAGAFNSTGLNEITFPNSVTRLSFGVCSGCVNLEKVKIEGEVTEICSRSFELCESLKYIDLPETLSVIHYRAFDCSGLEKITIPKLVKKVGKGAFTNCNKLKEITIESKNVKLVKYSFGYSYDFIDYKKIDGFTIKGYKGSTAEKYANENGFNFVPLD